MQEKKAKIILLVEDEPITAMMEKKNLEEYRYAVTHVHTGEEAVKAALEEKKPIDLILMDIDLGSGIDGTEAAEKILTQTDIPVVFLSSHTEPEIVEKTEKITSYGYVVKNTGMTVLDASIKMAFKLFEAKIKEREKEDALQESEERLSLALEVTNSGIWEFNPRTFNDCHYNDKWFTMLGYNPDELPHTAETWLTLIHPEDLEHFQRKLQDHIEGKNGFFVEFRMKRKSGNYCWVNSIGKIVSWDNKKKPRRMIGINYDISGRKESEKALLNEKILSEKFIDSLPGLFYVFDEKQFVRRNKQWETITEYSPEELKTMYGPSFFNGSEKKLMERKMKEVFEKGASHAEACLVTKHGKRIPYYFTGVRQKINGRPHLIGLGIDISERKKVEESLKKSLQEKSPLFHEQQRRIKDNLSMVCNIISLSMTYTEPGELKSAMVEIESRIKTIFEPRAD
ncbi:MAG: PAS domain-containing protein [bacterium]|nr:PAS domain-containing protein [bacterium]